MQKRQVVNIDQNILEIVKKEKEYDSYKLSALCNKLLLEALEYRRNNITVAQVESFITKWSREDIVNHLQNVINHLSMLESEPIESDIGDIALHFVRSLVEVEEMNNQDLSLLSHELDIDIQHLTLIRNLIYQTQKNATFDSCE